MQNTKLALYVILAVILHIIMVTMAITVCDKHCTFQAENPQNKVVFVYKAAWSISIKKLHPEKHSILAQE